MQRQVPRLHVGQRLKRWLAFKGWSARDLAARANIPYSTLQDYLSDERSPGASHLASMARVGIDLSWLLGVKPRGALAPAPNLEGTNAELVNADLELMRALYQKARELVDLCQLQHFKKTGAPMPFDHALSLFSRLLRAHVSVAHGMAATMADLRKHGVETDTIAEVIASSLRSRLNEFADKAAAATPGEIDAVLIPLIKMSEEEASSLINATGAAPSAEGR